MFKFIIVISLILMSFISVANDCIKTRAAFDIGSGSTKVKVAKVNICTLKIVKLILEENRAVGYKQALKDSKSNILSDEILKIGIDNILELKKLASQYKPSMYVAVATSAFRTADNGIKAAEKISGQIGIKVNIISQEKEAKIGFVGAAILRNQDLKDIVVWDIGGGSMQMTYFNESEKFNMFLGSLASVSFKNYIIENIKKRDPTKLNTPNPITENEKIRLLIDLYAYSRSNIPKQLKKKISKKSTQVIGIGGVHYYSVGKVVSNTKSYSINMIREKLNQLLDKSDEELGGGKYVDTSVSNLILVLGIMQELGIDEVFTGKINMADGLLVKPELII